jgi:hypothetical protein
MAPRSCWICGAIPASEEHVWAKWLKRITRHPIGKYQIGVTSDPENWREWTGATFEHTARVLCRRCNQRLGELEGYVRPIVDRLLSGADTSIAPAEQKALAHWLYKTGLMVSTTLDHEATAIPRWHYQDLDASLDLPPASIVWIGLLDQRVNEVALWVQRFQWWDKFLPDPPESEGYLFVLGIGELAAVAAVLDTRQSPDSTDLNPFRLEGLGAGRLLRIWPSSNEYGLRWPPPLTIRGEDLKRLADAFVRPAGRSDA